MSEGAHRPRDANARGTWRTPSHTALMSMVDEEAEPHPKTPKEDAPHGRPSARPLDPEAEHDALLQRLFMRGNRPRASFAALPSANFRPQKNGVGVEGEACSQRLPPDVWGDEEAWSPQRPSVSDKREVWPTAVPSVPRHSAPHSALEVHAAEARLRADRLTPAWPEENGILSRRPSGGRAPPISPHSPLSKPSSSHLPLSPTSHLPHSPASDGSGAALSRHSSLDHGTWMADSLAPSMQWPPPKRMPMGHSQSLSRGSRRNASLQVTTDFNDSLPHGVGARSASASLWPSRKLAESATNDSPRRTSSIRSSSSLWPPLALHEPPAERDERRGSDPVAALARMSLSDPPMTSPTSKMGLDRTNSHPASPAGALDAQAQEYTPYMPYYYSYMPPASPSLSIPVRSFVIKSFTDVDVEKSLVHGVWTSTEKGNRRLDQAWATSGHIGPIYLFFSVNGSGRFCGVAQMMSGLDYSQSSSIWAEGHRWKGLFRVRWLLVKDVPNSQLRHILLSNVGEVKPVTQSRDTQELLPAASNELLRIFCTYMSYSTLPAAAEMYNGYRTDP